MNVPSAFRASCSQMNSLRGLMPFAGLVEVIAGSFFLFLLLQILQNNSHVFTENTRAGSPTKKASKKVHIPC